MESPPAYAPHALSSLDFETASIRSAAPSYISAAPTYVSNNFSPTTNTTSSPRRPTSQGLLRVHSAPQEPSLDRFRIPTWSPTHTDPKARHYHNVAHRRATMASVREEQSMLAATLPSNTVVYKSMLERMEEEREEGERLNEEMGGGMRGYRALEDPYLVGEEEAERARAERLARENGNAVLVREDKRWDWLLSQMKDWEERDRSWKKFRDEVSEGKRSKLARRLGLGKRSM